MAHFEFRLPDIGEGIAEAEIVAWHVQIGDMVEEDQRLADMMTDKATVEMESPVGGIVIALAGDVGTSIAIGSTLVVIETGRKEAPAAGKIEEKAGAEAPEVEEATKQDLSPFPRDARKKGSEETPALPARNPLTSSAPEEEREHKTLASPAVRQRAKDLGIDLAQVKTDGDRIRHADLDAYLRYGSDQGYGATSASRAREDEIVKVIGMRRHIAEAMSASKRHIPHFTYVEEIDVTALEEMRAELNANRGSRPKLTMLPFLIVAICRILPGFPMLNARYDDEAGMVTRSGRVHLGMATRTGAGLMVPVIRDAQDRNVWQLASEISRLAEAARTSKLQPDEMSGGTITLSSLGPLGGIASTPVINRPEVAIIAPNRIIERPVFDGDKIRRAKCMNLSISCDHRIIDGWEAANYVQLIKRQLESPILLFAD